MNPEALAVSDFSCGMSPFFLSLFFSYYRLYLGVLICNLAQTTIKELRKGAQEAKIELEARKQQQQ